MKFEPNVIPERTRPDGGNRTVGNGGVMRG